MAFDKGNPKVAAADIYISGKSAHQLLAAIGTGTLPEGVTPAMVGLADMERTARKLAARPA
jgi:hypothetical protein